MTQKILPKLISSVSAVLLSAVLLAFPVLAENTAPNPDAQTGARTITVSGSGSVHATPDVAEIQFSSQSLAETVTEAQNLNTESVNAVLKVLADLNVEEKDIQTSGYSLYPQYDYDGGEDQRISGYMASTDLTIRGQTLDMAAKILDACISAGINYVNGITYTCSTYDEAYSEALAQAVSSAKAKAEVLAQAAGGELGAILSVDEGYQDSSWRAESRTSSLYDGAKEAASDLALMPGQADITANVSVTYSLR